MWDLPGPGLEPMSPALAGGFCYQGSPPHFFRLEMSTAKGLCFPASSVVRCSLLPKFWLEFVGLIYYKGSLKGGQLRPTFCPSLFMERRWDGWCSGSFNGSWGNSEDRGTWFLDDFMALSSQPWTTYSRSLLHEGIHSSVFETLQLDLLLEYECN